MKRLIRMHFLSFFLPAGGQLWDARAGGGALGRGRDDGAANFCEGVVPFLLPAAGWTESQSRLRCRPLLRPATALCAQYGISHTRLKKKHNIDDERKCLYETVRARGATKIDHPQQSGGSPSALKSRVTNHLPSLPCSQVGDFTAALGKRKFLGGEQPSLADVALFGMVRAVRGMETFADVMANTDLRPWFERMEGAVGASARVPETCNVA